MTDLQAKRKTVDTLVRYYIRRWHNSQVQALYRVTDGMTEFWSFSTLRWVPSAKHVDTLMRTRPDIVSVTAEDVRSIRRDRALQQMAALDVWLKRNP